MRIAVRGLIGGNERIAASAVLVDLVRTEEVSHQGHNLGLGLLAAAVVVRVGIDLVADAEVISQLAVNADVLEVRRLELKVIAGVVGGGRAGTQTIVATQGVDLRLRHSARVGETDLVISRQHRDGRVIADGLQILEVIGIAIHIGIAAIAVSAHLLIAGDQRAALEVFANARVHFIVLKARAPAAIAIGRNEAGGRARVLGQHAQRATKGGLTDGAGLARTAVNEHLTDQLGREVTGGVMRPVVLVTERDAIKRDVVLVVVKAADGQMLGLTQTGAVGLDVGHARRDVGNGRKISSRRDAVSDVGQTDDRAGLKGVELDLSRCLAAADNGFGNDLDLFQTVSSTRCIDSKGGSRQSAGSQHRQPVNMFGHKSVTSSLS